MFKEDLVIRSVLITPGIDEDSESEHFARLSSSAYKLTVQLAVKFYSAD